MRSVSFLHVLFAPLLALAAACSAGGESGPACETEADCPARSRCQERLCVSDAAPVAHVQGPSQAVASALATFDASGSSDPDSGDAIVGWRWSIRAVDEQCEPPAAPPSAVAVKLRFPCDGRWSVDLVVVDTMGSESAVASHEVEVAPWSGTPRVTAGEDVILAHRCSGEPLRCTTADAEGAEVAVALAASVAAGDADTAGLTYAWTATPPPGLGLSDERRVELTPGESGSATAVIETSGAAIAGQWLFTLAVSDAYGLVGTADQLVTIENRAPEIDLSVPAAVAHRYDPSRRFTAGGVFPLSVVDPDGDPIARRSLLARQLNVGTEDSFEATDLGDAITVYAEVRYDAPEDALHLIGPDVIRELELTVEDVNGGVVTLTTPLVIDNAPPRPITSVASATVGHTFDAAAQTYRATAMLSRWIDDDGDPIFRDEPTNNGTCDTLTVDDSGQSRVHCALAYQGVPAALGQFASTHVVDQRVRDPFSWGSTVAPASVTITNRPPEITQLPAAKASVTCSKDDSECCTWDFDLKRCVEPARFYGEGSTTVSPTVTDPDGDPVRLEARSCSYVDSAICTGGPCRVTVATCGTVLCYGSPNDTAMSFTASDGSLSDVEGGAISVVCR